MLKIETSEKPKNKDFGKFFVILNTRSDFSLLVKLTKKHGIRLKQGDCDELDNFYCKYYLDCTKEQLKKFMRNEFCNRICRYCSKKGKRKTMKVCSRCEISWYCSKKCQKECWKKHKKFCTKFKKMKK